MSYTPYVVAYTTDSGLAMLVQSMGFYCTVVSYGGTTYYCFDAATLQIPSELSADFNTSILYYSFMLEGGW